jgi:hypothetical protein
MLDNKVHWFILQGLPGGDIGFFNIYTPNESSHRIRLWEALMTDLPNTCRWTLVGDFNMVELRQDKTSKCGGMLPLAEPATFMAMKSHLQVSNNALSPSSQKFSWDNLRQDGSRVLARLDHVYLFQAIGTTSRKLVSYRICGDLAWSDHLPVEATVATRKVIGKCPPIGWRRRSNSSKTCRRRSRGATLFSRRFGPPLDFIKTFANKRLGSRGRTKLRCVIS